LAKLKLTYSHYLIKLMGFQENMRLKILKESLLEWSILRWN